LIVSQKYLFEFIDFQNKTKLIHLFSFIDSSIKVY
jgi:hypothetical protein